MHPTAPHNQRTSVVLLANMVMILRHVCQQTQKEQVHGSKLNTHPVFFPCKLHTCSNPPMVRQPHQHQPQQQASFSHKKGPLLCQHLLSLKPRHMLLQLAHQDLDITHGVHRQHNISCVKAADQVSQSLGLLDADDELHELPTGRQPALTAVLLSCKQHKHTEVSRGMGTSHVPQLHSLHQGCTAVWREPC